MPELLLRGAGACMLDLCTIHNRILGDVALGADSFAIGEAHLAAVSPPGDWVLIGRGPGAAISLGLVRKTPFWGPLYTENIMFAKTASGQT